MKKRVRGYTSIDPTPIRSWPFVLLAVLSVLIVILIMRNNADKAPQRVRVFSAVPGGEGVAVSIISESTPMSHLIQQLHTLHFALPSSWHLQLVCYPKACEMIKNEKSFQRLIQGEHVVVTPLSEEASILTRQELLLSLYFWEALLHDKVVLFDEQTIFCNNEEVLWSNFSRWDFILTPSVSVRQRNPSIICLERWFTQHQTDSKSLLRKKFIPGVKDERLWFMEQLRFNLDNPLKVRVASVDIENRWLGTMSRAGSSFAILKDSPSNLLSMCL